MLSAKLEGPIFGLDHGDSGVHVSTLAGDWSGGILVVLAMKKSACTGIQPLCAQQINHLYFNRKKEACK